MTRPSRVVTVTLGLLGAGALAGGVAGAAVAALLAEILWGPAAAMDAQLLSFGATFGAGLGALLLPAAGWGLMRRVPLGRALLGTAAGAIGGGVLSWFVPIGHDEIGRALAGGVIGFLVAVLALRRTLECPLVSPTRVNPRRMRHTQRQT